jgi:hypothetical protein
MTRHCLPTPLIDIQERRPCAVLRAFEISTVVDIRTINTFASSDIRLKVLIAQIVRAAQIIRTSSGS